MILRIMNGKIKAEKKFGRTDTGAPGDFGCFIFRRSIQGIEVVGHNLSHKTSGLDSFD
jgi:hypothetical protein